MAADGSIVIETNIDDKKAQQELNSLTKKIDSLQDKLNQKQGKQSALAEEARQIGIEYDNARKKLEQMQSGDTFYTSSHIKEQEAAVKSLENEWSKTAMAADKLRTEIYDGTQQLNNMKERAGEIQQRLAAAGPSTERMSKAMERMQKSANKFSMRLREVVRSALVFTVISQGLAALREWMGKVVKSNDEATAAIARLKGALLTLAQPLVNVIIPAFTTFVNILAAIVSRVAELVSALFGTTAEASAAAAESLYNETEAIEGTGNAAKKASKSLASFDEINQLSGGSTSGSSGGTSGSSEIKPDFDTSFISNTIDEIVSILGGALLAIGAILAFSGANIPLGIGLMAAGAAILGGIVAENWGAIAQMLQGPLGVMMGLLSGALLVLGAILTFSGANIPLGIGLMVAGAVGLAASIAANWDTLSTVLQGPIGVIVGLLSSALLVIGAILAFSGANLPLGIGLLVAGSVGLATSVAANWSTIQSALQGPIGTIVTMVSTALLAVGAILAFSGASLPLGIGLIAVGAIGLATSIAANWSTIQTALGGPIGAITALIGTALLVIGAVLLFSGAGIPLGLGLLVAGGSSLAMAITPNWDFILDAISGAWNNFTSWWEAGPSKFFTLDYWAGLASDMMDGLFNGLASIGERITNWGSNFIDGVKDFFGIHSPSTEFETLGGYMMAGLGGGVTGGSSTVVSAFSVMFASVLTLCTNNTDLMKAELVAFLLYMSSEFVPEWKTVWTDCHDAAFQNIQSIMTEIDALNAKLASIERNILITITTVYQTIGSPSSGGRTTTTSTSRSASSLLRSISLTNIPALARGAVIPPNREFLAVLGDQKQGTNVEAPLSTIEQAVANVMNRMGYGGEQTVILQVDKDQLGKVVYKLNKTETRRIGVNLAGV